MPNISASLTHVIDEPQVLSYNIVDYEENVVQAWRMLELEHDTFMIFHAMKLTKKMSKELGL